MTDGVCEVLGVKALHPVILNSFQDPSRRSDEASGSKPNPTASDTIAMLPQSLHHIGSYTDRKRPTLSARKDINAGAALNRHVSVMASSWMLKQVQHDGRGVS